MPWPVVKSQNSLGADSCHTWNVKIAPSIQLTAKTMPRSLPMGDGEEKIQDAHNPKRDGAESLTIL